MDEGFVGEPARNPWGRKEFDLLRSGVRWVLPESAMSVALKGAKDLSSLRYVRAVAARLDALVRDRKVAKEERNKLAEFHIRLARKIGARLRLTLRRGRPPKTYRGVGFRGGQDAPGLPAWMSWNESSRCQSLARISESECAQYFADVRQRGGLITTAGLLRAWTEARRTRAPAAETGEPASLDAVWDAVQRVTDVSVAVGFDKRLVKGRTELPARGSLTKQLTGNVVALLEDRIEAWLIKLNAARVRGAVSQAIVVFRCTTREPWFRLLDTQGWTCCFVRGGTARSALVAAYLGDRRLAFDVATAGLGAVLRGE